MIHKPEGLLPIVTLITVALFDSHLTASNSFHHVYKSSSLVLALKRSPNFAVDCSIDIEYYSGTTEPLSFVCRCDPFTYYDQWYLDLVEPDNRHVHIATMEKSPSQYLIQLQNIFYVCSHVCTALSKDALPKGIPTTYSSGCCKDDYTVEELVWKEHLPKNDLHINDPDYIIRDSCTHVHYHRVMPQRSPLKRLSNYRMPDFKSSLA